VFSLNFDFFFARNDTMLHVNDLYCFIVMMFACLC